MKAGQHARERPWRTSLPSPHNKWVSLFSPHSNGVVRDCGSVRCAALGPVGSGVGWGGGEGSVRPRAFPALVFAPSPPLDTHGLPALTALSARHRFPLLALGICSPAPFRTHPTTPLLSAPQSVRPPARPRAPGRAPCPVPQPQQCAAARTTHHPHHRVCCGAVPHRSAHFLPSFLLSRPLPVPIGAHAAGAATEASWRSHASGSGDGGRAWRR
jgi:hypothetical protein